MCQMQFSNRIQKMFILWHLKLKRYKRGRKEKFDLSENKQILENELLVNDFVHRS